MTIPDPAIEPFWDVEQAARFLGIGKSLAYDLISRDEFPVPVLRFGTRIKVPTKALVEAAGLSGTVGQ